MRPSILPRAPIISKVMEGLPGAGSCALFLILALCQLEGNTSYDSVFKWIGQGQISLRVPFGGKRGVRKNYNCCSTAIALSRRAVQPVDRNEIIPVDHKHKITKLAAPAFIFVDSNSHSQGTWESPYPTMTEAELNSGPNDIIYVLPGNGSPYDVTSGGGFVMQDGQKLWGSSVAHEVATPFGNITVPALSQAMPSVTSTGTTSVITLGNNGEVAGMEVLGSGLIYGIYGPGVSGLVQNNVLAFTLDSFNGIFFTNSAANTAVSILNNQISGNASLSSGIVAESFGSGAMSVSIQGNQISNTISAGGTGIVLENFSTEVLTATISNNQISDINCSGSFDGIFLIAGGTADFEATISGNQFLNLAAEGNATPIFFVTLSSGNCNAAVQNNQISNITSSLNSVVGVEIIAFSPITLSISNDQLSTLSSASSDVTGIEAINVASASVFSITNNQLSDIQSSTTASGILAENFSSGAMTCSILGNQVGALTAPVITGIGVENFSGTACLTLIGNDAASSPIQLTNGGGTFNVSTIENNVPAPTGSGVFTNVPSCP